MGAAVSAIKFPYHYIVTQLLPRSLVMRPPYGRGFFHVADGDFLWARNTCRKPWYINWLNDLLAVFLRNHAASSERKNAFTTSTASRKKQASIRGRWGIHFRGIIHKSSIGIVVSLMILTKDPTAFSDSVPGKFRAHVVEYVNAAKVSQITSPPFWEPRVHFTSFLRYPHTKWVRWFISTFWDRPNLPVHMSYQELKRTACIGSRGRTTLRSFHS